MLFQDPGGWRGDLLGTVPDCSNRNLAQREAGLQAFPERRSQDEVFRGHRGLLAGV